MSLFGGGFVGAGAHTHTRTHTHAHARTHISPQAAGHRARVPGLRQVWPRPRRPVHPPGAVGGACVSCVCMCVCVWVWQPGCPRILVQAPTRPCIKHAHTHTHTRTHTHTHAHTTHTHTRARSAVHEDNLRELEDPELRATVTGLLAAFTKLQFWPGACVCVCVRVRGFCCVSAPLPADHCPGVTGRCAGTRPTTGTALALLAAFTKLPFWPCACLSVCLRFVGAPPCAV